MPAVASPREFFSFPSSPVTGALAKSPRPLLRSYRIDSRFVAIELQKICGI